MWLVTMLCCQLHSRLFYNNKKEELSVWEGEGGRIVIHNVKVVLLLLSIVRIPECHN